MVVLLVALGAGALAALLAAGSPPAKTVVVQQPAKQIDTVDVLIASVDIGTGNTVKPGDIAWEAWPAAAAGPQFITREHKPDAPEALSGTIARTAFAKGEPIREAKLIRADGSGFMAAMLPPGMRATSVEITPETGAAGFILPNDRVDVILTKRSSSEKADAKAETVLVNVRVLAIDQTIEEKNGDKVVVGKTATLELNGRQTETLAQARQSGSISLALRSIADATDTEPVRDGGVNIIYGMATGAGH
ncbi:Flp pilus assembly protein RcpC/CpaB [Blastochloris viridis]|uniref:Flp pilus assembly protein RcpC/CpaB n=1 Tax=Blastochloris viridis TaxID=1079 RepID=A0A182D211_BLAVI|nr:Flp pilus assembly protein RcpC/CpaB [Blastochloris viridis]